MSNMSRMAKPVFDENRSDVEAVATEPPPAKRRRKSPAKSSSQQQQPLQDQSNIIYVPKHASSSRLKSSPSMVVEESDAELMELGLHRIVDASGESGGVALVDTSHGEASFSGDRGGGGDGCSRSEEKQRLRLLGQSKVPAAAAPLVSISPAHLRPRRIMSRRSSIDLVQMWSQPLGPNRFDRLSDEMVIQVLKWLPKVTLARVALVCQRFNTLSTDEVFWRRVDLGLKALPQGVLGQVLHRGASVLRAARAAVTSPIFQTVTGFVYPPDMQNKLQYLDLSVASISLPDLEELLTTCFNLRKLALENLQISDRVCHLIAQNSVLNTLHLGMTRGISEAGIIAILRNCRQLRELNIGWTEMNDMIVAALVNNLHANIERLNLSGCRDTLQDWHVEAVVTRCSRMLELDVSDALNLSVNSVDVICSGGLARLESLSTSRCYNIVPAAYLALESCPSLRYLNVFGVLKEAALAELKRRLPRIEINKFLFTSVARPTVGIKRTSIWGLRVRD